MAKLKPNNWYFVWLAVKNHPEGCVGIPVDEPLRFQPARPPEKDGVFWVHIGHVMTDADGNVPFFKAQEEG